MEGIQTKDIFRTKNPIPLNALLAQKVLQKALDIGVTEFCLCGGKRSAFFSWILHDNPSITTYDWFEERSAAFFALGKSKKTKAPVAVITTSGTAVGELLPAVMEAFYTSYPLLLITADRPRTYRGSGAPQAAEQVGIFGPYTSFSEDLERHDCSQLENWDQKSPAHVNVCFDEKIYYAQTEPLFLIKKPLKKNEDTAIFFTLFDEWAQKVHAPLALVSTLPDFAKKSVSSFLQKLKIPCYLEAPSGLREEKDLSFLRIHEIESLIKNDYPLDGIIRIGGVPTTSFWRRLEDQYKNLPVCSISPYPFSGLSCGTVIPLYKENEWEKLPLLKIPFFSSWEKWKRLDELEEEKFQTRLKKNRFSELSLISSLSKKIPSNSFVFLGSSSPIREWDKAATFEKKNFCYFANRGLNGIDGAISTFLGLADKTKENWAILGDLTTLYDMAGLWILNKMKEYQIRIVVINNGGGQYFSSMERGSDLVNSHSLDFYHLAALFQMEYTRCTTIPEKFKDHFHQLIELVPSV